MTKYILPVWLFSCLFYCGCSSNPYASTNRLYRKQAKDLVKQLTQVPLVSNYGGKVPPYSIGTVNLNLRKPNYVIIHHTAQNSCEQTLKTFTLQRTQVSAHYVICKDGTVHHMLNDYFRAWHAGNSKWGSETDINSASIGIELDNNGTEAFSESQISSLMQLLAVLKTNYKIPTANFIGHSDIAPGRKVDPNAFFPWQELSKNGYGNWPDSLLDTVPTGFNGVAALRLIGYNVSDSLAAIRSFKLHFIPTDQSPGLTIDDKAVLNNLLKKY
ncbi:N-acetylmuramoyl-L-alanine amidase [Arcticibacter eurypsychrophilus]|uniref:N-acetylmuramoyl-L-alanine amidase n=1 Tax=Arcticibacter eurypsychrophilus TaxID=1434752 RepID=UPI00084D0E73|nr:N-acetylmuramoyl-L-alanine amidase [Arcticibacter eurypsychrophilus]